MGHANLSNISTFFLKMIRQRNVSVKEVVDALEKAGETLNASEGAYKDRSMLSMGMGDVLVFLSSPYPSIMEWLDPEVMTASGRKEMKEFPVITPVKPLTPQQEKVFDQWKAGAIGNWGCGDDGNGGQYGIFDSIKWQMRLKWKEKTFRKLPVLAHVTH